MNILILEDSQERIEKFTMVYKDYELYFCTTSTRCIEKLQEQRWDVLFLDHDLGGQIMVESGPGTGYEVARWIKGNPQYKPEFVVIHSMNPEGSARMSACLPDAYRIPGAWAENIIREG